MSELKAFDITVAEEGYCEGIVKYRRAVYDKSEADKVIARHKYKRCLAMARWCMARYNEWVAYYPTMTTRKMKFLDKWEKRWRELAEEYNG